MLVALSNILNWPSSTSFFGLAQLGLTGLGLLGGPGNLLGRERGLEGY